MITRLLASLMMFATLGITASAQEISETALGCPLFGPCETEKPPAMILRITNDLPGEANTIRRDKGSAVLVEKEGAQWALTAAHIFRDGKGKITMTTMDGRNFKAAVYRAESDWDVVLLAFEGDVNLPSIPLAAAQPRPGEATVAWGFGRDGRVAGQRGRVVDYVRTEKGDTSETLKTTGRARDGDSGGPVLNDRGELVGLLWGTDGRYTYATSITRLRKILDSIETKTPLLPPPPEVPVVTQKPFEPAANNNVATRKDAESEAFSLSPLQKILLQRAAAALGIGSPTLLALWFLARCLWRRRKQDSQTNETENAAKSGNRINLDDAYATQLNGVYELSGHSPTADATLGRLYDQKLREAEDSSSADLARTAKLLRDQVATQFLRIHSSNPPPAES